MSVLESLEFGLGLVLAGTEGFTASLLMIVGADAAFAGARVPLAIDVLPPPADGNERLDAGVGGPPGLGALLLGGGELFGGGLLLAGGGGLDDPEPPPLKVGIGAA